MDPAKRLLVVGRINASLVIPRLAPVLAEMTIVGKPEAISELEYAPAADLDKFLSQVKVAVVHYTDDDQTIFKKLAKRSIPCIIILPYSKAHRQKKMHSLVRGFMEMGAKGVFLEDFVDNNLAAMEFFRQIEKFAL